MALTRRPAARYNPGNPVKQRRISKRLVAVENSAANLSVIARYPRAGVYLPKRRHVRFSNRPFGVKHFQTIHQCDVDVARGLVLLFGIGTGAFPSWDSRTRRNNLLVGLAVEERRVQADIRTHLIHRPARDIFPPLGGALVFSYRVHAAAVACSLVQQNSVPSTHMRCMITASRRAKATIAFFIPRRLAICMAHALSQDHFFECIML